MKASFPDKHWLRSAIPRNLALSLWRLSEVETDLNKRLDLLKRAYELTFSSLKNCKPGSRQESLMLNSAVYYAVEYLTLAPKNGAPLGADTLRRLVQDMSANVQIETSVQLRPLDTLCRAFSYLEMEAEAVRAATRVAALIERIEAPSLGHDERDMLKYAQGVLSRAAPAAEQTLPVVR